METLYDYRKNINSQHGEDGIIQKIFEIIGTRSKVCIEFGAWDGFHLSNTAALWANSWKGILIEADESKYSQLIENVKSYNCVPIHAFVGTGQEDSLEAILQKNGINESIDLLSIDIDGNDYYIFQSLNQLKPRVIICEYNPTMPAHIDIYPENPNYIGCSVAALIRVAETKGYRLVALTEVNAFFVIDEEFDKFSSYETRLECIKIDSFLTYFITSYSGEFLPISLSYLPYGMSQSFKGKLNGSFVQPINFTD